MSEVVELETNRELVIENHVSSPLPSQRAMGRLLASEAVGNVEAWIQSEIDRDTCPVDVMMALVNFTVSIVGSIAAQAVKPEGDKSVVNLFAVMAADRVAEHIRMTRAQLAENAA